MKKLDNAKITGIAAMLLALAVAACGDDPATPPDDHPEAEGVLLVLSGQTVAAYDGDDGSWRAGDTLTVSLGEETAHIAVRFVDHDGDPVPEEDDTYLDVVVADESIAEFEQDTPGEFGGHLHGKAVGETTARFRLMHGEVGSGHPDFETRPLPVKVTGMI